MLRSLLQIRDAARRGNGRTTHSRRIRARERFRQLALEPLEDRRLLAADPSIQGAEMAEVMHEASPSFFGSQSYESNYRPGTSYSMGYFPSVPGAPNFAGGVAHDFDPGPASDNWQGLTLAGGAPVARSFQWDQPFASSTGAAGAATDMGIHPLNAAYQFVAAGLDSNVGVDPVEVLRFTNATGAPQNDGTPDVRFRLEAVDKSGAPITSARVGEQFLLNVYVQDTRPYPAGVFRAYLDVLFDSQRVSLPSGLQHGPWYSYLRSGDLSTPGLIDEAGGVSFVAPGDPEPLLFSAVVAAKAVGTATFQADPADLQPEHDVTLYRPDPTIALDPVDYGSLTLQILAGDPDFTTFEGLCGQLRVTTNPEGKDHDNPQPGDIIYEGGFPFFGGGGGDPTKRGYSSVQISADNAQSGCAVNIEMTGDDYDVYDVSWGLVKTGGVVHLDSEIPSITFMVSATLDLDSTDETVEIIATETNGSSSSDSIKIVDAESSGNCTIQMTGFPEDLTEGDAGDEDNIVRVNVWTEGCTNPATVTWGGTGNGAEGLPDYSVYFGSEPVSPPYTPLPLPAILEIRLKGDTIPETTSYVTFTASADEAAAPTSLEILIYDNDGQSEPEIQVFDAATCPTGGDGISSGAEPRIDLGPVQQGQTLARTLTVKNADTATDDLENISLAPESWFVVGSESGSDLVSSLPIGSCDPFTITIVDTSSIGENLWDLKIYSTDLDENPFVVKLRAEVTSEPSTEPDVSVSNISADGTKLTVLGSYADLSAGDQFRIGVYGSLDKVTRGTPILGETACTVPLEPGPPTCIIDGPSAPDLPTPAFTGPAWNWTFQPGFDDVPEDYYVLAAIEPLADTFTDSDENNNQAVLESGVFRSEGTPTVLHMHGGDSNDKYAFSEGATGGEVNWTWLQYAWPLIRSGPPYPNVNGDGWVSGKDAQLIAAHLAGYLPWSNTHEPSDVNDDKSVTALDVLLLVNKINAYGTGPLTRSDTPLLTGRFYDPDGSGSLTANDVLWVINYINALEMKRPALQNPATPRDVNGDHLVTWDDWEGALSYLALSVSAWPQPYQPVAEIHVRTHAGEDVVSAAAVEVPVWVFGGPGADTIFAGTVDDQAWGGDGDDIIFGGPGNDDLRGESGHDCLNGGPGDDNLVQGEGTSSCAAKEPPEARDDAYAVQEDQTLTVPAPGLLANDLDQDIQDDFLLKVETTPVQNVAHGTLTLDVDGSFVYTPGEDFYGTDQFVYQLDDGWNHNAEETEEAMRATVYITVQEVADPVVTVQANPAFALEESSQAGAFIIRRWPVTSAELTVSYAISGTATEGEDYNELPASRTATIPAGSDRVEIPVTPNNDGDPEGAETVILALQDTAVYSLGGTGSATVTIVDGEIGPQVKIEATEPDAWEPGWNGEPVVRGQFTISRENVDPAVPMSVRYTEPLGGTAQPVSAGKDADYALQDPAGGWIVIPANATSVVIDVVPF